MFINGGAAAAFAGELPALSRTADALAFVGELGPEVERSKGAGKSHDADRNSGRYLELDDDGTIGTGFPLAGLTSTRESYDTALRAVGGD